MSDTNTYEVKVNTVANLMYFNIPENFNYTPIKKPGYNINNVYISTSPKQLFVDIDLYSTNINNTQLTSPTGVYTTTSTVTIDNESEFDSIFNIKNMEGYILEKYKYSIPGEEPGQASTSGSYSPNSSYLSQTYVNTVELRNIAVNWTYVGPTGYIGPTQVSGGPNLIPFKVPFIKFESILSYTTPAIMRGKGGPVPPSMVDSTTTKGITPLSWDKNGETLIIFDLDNFESAVINHVTNEYDSPNYISNGYNPFTDTKSAYTYLVFPSSGSYYVPYNINLYYILIGGGGSGGIIGKYGAGGGAGGTLVQNTTSILIPSQSTITVTIGVGGNSTEASEVSTSGNASVLQIIDKDNSSLLNTSAGGGNPGISKRTVFETFTRDNGTGGINTNQPKQSQLGWGGNSASSNQNYRGYNGPIYNFLDGTGTTYTFAGGGGSALVNGGVVTPNPGGSKGGGTGTAEYSQAAAEKVPITLNGALNVDIYVGSGGGASVDKGGMGGNGLCVLYFIQAS